MQAFRLRRLEAFRRFPKCRITTDTWKLTIRFVRSPAGIAKNESSAVVRRTRITGGVKLRNRKSGPFFSRRTSRFLNQCQFYNFGKSVFCDARKIVGVKMHNLKTFL